MPIIQDQKAIQAGLEGGIKVLLNQLIDGTIQELDGPVRETSQRLAIAVRRGRQDLVQESSDQLALIVREKELRIKQSAGGMFDSVLALGMNALVNGAIAGLSGLKSV